MLPSEKVDRFIEVSKTEWEEEAEGFRYCENHPDTVIPCRACMYTEKD